MRIIAYENFSCEVVHDCLGFQMKFSDGKEHRAVNSMGEWVAAFNEKFSPLVVKPETIHNLRAVLDSAFQHVATVNYELADDETRMMNDMIYLDQFWNWFGEAKKKAKSYIPNYFITANGDIDPQIEWNTIRVGR